MRRIHVLVGFVAIVLLVPILGSLAPMVNISEKESVPNTIAPVQDTQVSGAGGEDYLLTNVVKNPSFEETNSIGAPEDWGYWSSSYTFQNISYQDETHAGSYSALIRARGYQSTSRACIYQHLGDHYPPSAESENLPSVNEGLTLDFYWNATSIPTLEGGTRLYAYCQFRDGISGQYYYMYYAFLHGSWSPGNSSNSCYILANGTVGIWNNGHLEITTAFTEQFGSPAASTYLQYIYFYAASSQSESDFVEMLIDDTSLTNSTAFEFLGNRDFEGTSEWSYSNRAPGFVETTSAVSTDGAQSMNLTAANLPKITNSYAAAEYWIGYYEGLFPTDLGESIIEFDWMYTDVEGGGGSQEADFHIWYDNSSHSYRAHYLFGRGNDLSPYSNSSSDVYFKVPGFGSRGVWNHFAIDLHDMIDHFNLTGGTCYDMYWEVTSGTQDNSTVNLFIDDFKSITYPSYDPGFEQDWYWSTSDSILGWHTTGSSYPYQNITTDSHSGKYAANLTTWDGPGTGIYRHQFVPITPSHHTDFWWRLDYVNGDAAALSYIQLQFYNVMLNYIVGATPSTSYANSTNIVYYTVNGFNQTGVWTNLVRNPWNDLNEAFGQRAWNLTGIICYADSSSMSNISVLFDDIHFVMDTHGPVISSVTRETVSPMYYDPVLVSAQASDLDIDTVQLHFNNGSWSTVDMTYTGTQYEAWITPAAYGIDVDFYVSANDTGGLTSVDDNSGMYYTYSSGDDVNPTVVIDHPLEDQIVEGAFSIELTVNDPGSGSSGVDYVELWDGSELLGSKTLMPWTFDIDSRTLANGTHNVGVIVYDRAGNSDMANRTFIVDNDVIGPVISEVIVNPENPTYGMDVHVSVTVTDYTAVENVTLYLSVDGGDWITVEMEQSGVLFTAAIWGRPWEVEINYYIVAYDTYGISTMTGSPADPFGYIVADNTAPVLSVSGPPISEAISGTVQFSLSASDAGSGIGDYHIEIDGASVETALVAADILVNEIFTLDTLTLENGNHTIAFIVSDGAGNLVILEIEYSVYNPVGLEGIGSALGDFMAGYGFFVGAGTVVVLMIAIRILLKRRRAA